jgi:ubiquinone/menaquinone biosynthesis C-methylase UbiE
MGSKEYFDEVAQDWDQMREGFFSDAVRQTAISTADIQPGRVAAYIGAGSGYVTEALVEKGLRVIAVDQSQSMLDEMRSRLSDPASVDYRVGQAESLPIADETVDYVFANMYLHHVQSPPTAIAEMVRVLRPSGRLVITDLDEHTFEFLRTEQHDRWLGFKRQKVERWLLKAGLTSVATDRVGEDCCAQSELGDGSAQVSIFVAYGDRATGSYGAGGR